MAHSQPAGTSLLSLPPALTEQVLSWLPVRDLASCFAASSSIRAAAQAALQHRTAWSSHEQGEVSHQQASRLFRFLGSHCPRLHRVSCCFGSDLLYGGSLLEASLTGLATCCRHLTRVALLNVDVTDKVLVQLASGCRGLQDLTLGRTENNAFGNFISDEGLSAVAASCTLLERLALFRCYSCTDAGLLSFPRAGRSLRGLTLHNCPQVTSYGISRFAEGCQALETLDVLVPDQGAAVSCLTFKAMFVIAANCPQLKVVRVSEELLSVSVLDDAALTLLVRGCPQLQELELVQVEVGDGLLRVLAQHGKQLQRLRLEQTYAGDEGVAALVAGCTQLRELRIAGCSPHCWMLPAELMFPGITQAALPGLAALRGQLQHLELSGLALAPPCSRSSGATSAPSSRDSTSSSTSSITCEEGPSSSRDRPLGSGSGSGSSSPSSSWASAESPDVAPVRDQRPCRAPRGGGGGCDQGGAVAKRRALSLSCGGSRCGGGPSDPDLAVCLQGLALQRPLLCPALASQLHALNLDWCKVDKEVLQPQLAATLRSCSSLQSLSLVGYQGDIEELLSQVATAAAPIRRLVLQHTPVADGGIALAVSAFGGLRALYLSYCRSVSDAALEALCRARHLQVLDLYNVPLVSDAAMAQLVRCCTPLTSLYIGNHTGALHASQPSQHQGSMCSASGSCEDLQLLDEACSARSRQVQLLRRNPKTDGGYEARTLQRLLE